MPSITPCLWYNGNAEAAVKFYKSVFKDLKIKRIQRYGAGQRRPEGDVLTIVFNLFGRDYMALNGDVAFPFSEAVSFIVNCKTQREIDTYWKKLTADGGREVQCGWLTDKFGFSWQIVPGDMLKLMGGKNNKKSEAVMNVVMKSIKLNIADMKKAYDKA